MEKQVKSIIVKQLDNQGDRVLLYGTNPDYYIIAPKNCTAQIGNTINYEPYGANFGWFIDINSSNIQVKVGDKVSNTFRASEEIAQRYRNYKWSSNQLEIFKGVKVFTVSHVYTDTIMLQLDGGHTSMPLDIAREMRQAYINQQDS